MDKNRGLFARIFLCLIVVLSVVWCGAAMAADSPGVTERSSRVAVSRGGGAAANRVSVVAAAIAPKPAVSAPEVVAPPVESEEARVGINMVANLGGLVGAPKINVTQSMATMPSAPGSSTGNMSPDLGGNTSAGGNNSGTCRDAYRDCMNEFCLAGMSDGERCICSDNFFTMRARITEIEKIQSDADTLLSTGVERENLGARADDVFGQVQESSQDRVSALIDSFLNKTNTNINESLGSQLYGQAHGFCAEKLNACAGSAEMETALYSRQIENDCRAFDTYLSDQKKIAEQNLAAAQRAVRDARNKMMDTTNKYPNAGTCMIAFESCIQNKGGCGQHYENCADQKLLSLRAKACENVLDQCTLSRAEVLDDWEMVRSRKILSDARAYVKDNAAMTCIARIDACLEESCSIATNSICLDNINNATNFCPVINECDKIAPGLKRDYGTRLTFMRRRFCQNDIDACMQDNCGADYSSPACVGKNTDQLMELCPQNVYPSCNGIADFEVVVAATILQTDYQMLTGCINHFSNVLGATCGLDMDCIPVPNAINNMKNADEEMDYLTLADAAVKEFFKKFENDKTVAACAGNVGDGIFTAAEIYATNATEDKFRRAYQEKVIELTRNADLETKKKRCETTMYDAKTMSARPVFEPVLSSCHICRTQTIQAKSGTSWGQNFAKAGIGGLATGASAGSGFGPWGAAIGGAVGLIGGGLSTIGSGEKIEEQKLEVCEDVRI